MDIHNWCKTPEDRISSLSADIAKQGNMIDSMIKTLEQLRAKNTFQLALLHQEQAYRASEGK